MKLKELMNRARNSSNNQSVWNPKKKKLKACNLSEDELLNMEVNPKLKIFLVDD